MKISIFLTIFNIFFLFNGTTSAQLKNQFILKAVIDTIPYAQYFITFQNNGKYIKDTISLNKESKFEYTGTITEPTILTLSITNTFNKNIVGNLSVYSFWVQPNKIIRLEGKRGWLSKGVKGLVTNNKQFKLENSDFEQIENSFKKKIKDTISYVRHIGGQELSSIEISRIYDHAVIDFILQKPQNYYGMYLLSKKINDKDSDTRHLKELFNGFPNDLKSTFLGQEVINKINAKILTQIGSRLPDFEQHDTVSNPVKLSDFRGKYVLIDFWASWCIPCRLENPILLNAYQKYREKGFEIIGISLDDEREPWLKAIKEDGLTWIQLSDLNSFDNAVARKFLIHAIPDNFLVDPDGIIINKGLKGQQLLDTLQKLFN